MNFGLLLVGIGLLAFPGLLGRRAVRLPSSEWTRVATLALTLGAASVYVGLVMTTLPPVLHAVHLEGVLRICDPVVHSLMIGGPLVGWVAAAIALGMSLAALRTLRRVRQATRTARIEPWLGTHTDHGDYELVVLPTPALLAVGVPGSTPQVVISQGLVDELDASRLQAVVGHELAHLSLRHSRLLIIVTVIERTLGVVPVVRRSCDAIRRSLEIWADDSAIERAHTTELSLRAALLAVAGSTSWSGEASSDTGVDVRARRLSDPSPCLSATVRGLTYLPAGGLLCVAAVLGAGWLLSSQQMLQLGGYC